LNKRTLHVFRKTHAVSGFSRNMSFWLTKEWHPHKLTKQIFFRSYLCMTFAQKLTLLSYPSSRETDWSFFETCLPSIMKTRKLIWTTLMLFFC